jgi:hypothetical protein
MTKLLALLALSPLALGACGSSGAADNGPDDSDAARVKFEQCLRNHGINVQSSPSSGSARATKIEFRGGKGGSPAKFEEAQKTCREQSGFKPRAPSAAEQNEFRDAALKFARCMRDRGIDMPDPQVREGGAMLQRGPAGVNPNSPRFKAAEKACAKLLPGGGPKGAGPGSGGGEVGVASKAP